MVLNLKTADHRDITGVILVGGKSRRMRRDKAFLEIGGTTLFEKILAVFRENFSRIFLVGDRSERFLSYDLQVYRDIIPGSALGGVYTGLYHATTDYVFISSCDLPFPSSQVLRHLCTFKGYDAVVPKLAQGYEPLFALYAKTCLEPIEKALKESRHCAYGYYPQINLKEIGEAELNTMADTSQAFRNLNTQAEYEKAKEESACIKSVF